MPSELQQNRYDQLIRRVGGIVGPGSKVSEVLTELFPTIDVENVPAELAVLGDTHLGFAGAGVTAAGAETPKQQLFNPVNSGMIVTITRFDVQTNIGATVRYGIEGAARGAIVGNASFRDSRLGVDTPTTTVLNFESTVGLSLHTGRILTVTDVMLPFFSERGMFVLAPGTGLTFNSEVAASTLNMQFYWRERVAEKSELNF